MRFLRRLHALLFIVGAVALFTGCTRLPDIQGIDELHRAIDNAPDYYRKEQAFVDSLETLLNALPAGEGLRKQKLLIQLSDNFENLNPEKSIVYARDALALSHDLGTRDAVLSGQICLANALTYCGIYGDAREVLDSIRSEELTISQRLDYWECEKRIYDNLARALPPTGGYSAKYRQESYSLADSILTVLPRGEVYHRFLWAEKMYDLGRFAEAQEITAKLLPEVKADTRMYSMAWYLESQIQKEIGTRDEYEAALVKSSVNDIRTWRLHRPAIPELINYLSRKGDTDNAYKLLTFYLRSINPEDSQMLPYSLVSTLPSLENSYAQKTRRTNMILTIVSAIALLLLAAALLMVRRLHKDRLHFKEMSAALGRRTFIQNSYMGNLIELCVVYSERLEDLKLLAMRKIQAGKSAELLEMIKSGKVTEPQMEHFYNVLDNVFLELYPEFIEKINDLLQPNERYDLVKMGRGLTPELRIYALVRMGITEASKISHILHYSTNTIYAYRNRLRSRAINRETFDDDIMDIKPGLKS